MRTHAATANAYGSSRLNVILNEQARADLETLRKLPYGDGVFGWDRSSSYLVRRALRVAVEHVRVAQSTSSKIARARKAATRSKVRTRPPAKVRTRSSSRPKARRRR